jgi:hypothetical protein
MDKLHALGEPEPKGRSAVAAVRKGVGGLSVRGCDGIVADTFCAIGYRPQLLVLGHHPDLRDAWQIIVCFHAIGVRVPTLQQFAAYRCATQRDPHPWAAPAGRPRLLLRSKWACFGYRGLACPLRPHPLFDCAIKHEINRRNGSSRQYHPSVMRIDVSAGRKLSRERMPRLTSASANITVKPSLA